MGARRCTADLGDDFVATPAKASAVTERIPSLLMAIRRALWKS